MFSGRVVAVGHDVTRFSVGDDVFGSADNGAYAELLALDEDASVSIMPSNLSHTEAAALPYGAFTALHFLRDVAEVKAGDKVLVIGATGGVGRYGVQIAKHFGAEVTGVARDEALVRSLGADHVIDYTQTDFTQNGEQYDVIFDTSGTSSFGKTKGSLSGQGRFVTLFMTLGVIVRMLLGAFGKGRKAKSGVALGKADNMDELRVLAEAGAIRPVIARRFPLADIVAAHTHLETARPHGAVMVTMGEPAVASDVTGERAAA